MSVLSIMLRLSVTAKARLLLQVRTNTLVKSAIIQVDATPFRQWYLQHYGVELGLKKKIQAVEEATGGQEHVTSQAEKVSPFKLQEFLHRQLCLTAIALLLEARNLELNFTSSSLYSGSKPASCVLAGRCLAT